MANTIVQHTHFASGQSLELSLHPYLGGAKVNADVAMTQPDAVNDPLLYELVVPENATGWHRGIVRPAGGGTPYALGDVFLKNDTGKYPLGQRAAPPVTVDLVTEAGKQSLGRVTVQFNTPAWNALTRSFDGPIVRGDEYSGDRALRITIANYPGRDLMAASAIVLTGKQYLPPGCTATPDEVSWTGTAEDAGDDGIALVFTPTAAQTSKTPALYHFDVQATWGAGEIETPVLPGATLTLVQDYSP